MRGHVLFVDDDERIRTAWKRSFSSEPFGCLFADSVGSALLTCREQPVEVVVSDYAMAGGTGLELFAALSELSLHPFKILVSGQAGMRVASDALNLHGVFRLFSKPCPVSELRLAIRLALTLAADNHRTQQESKVIQELERDYPGISQVRRSPTGEILL